MFVCCFLIIVFVSLIGVLKIIFQSALTEHKFNLSVNSQIIAQKIKKLENVRNFIVRTKDVVSGLSFCHGPSKDYFISPPMLDEFDFKNMADENIVQLYTCILSKRNINLSLKGGQEFLELSPLASMVENVYKIYVTRILYEQRLYNLMDDYHIENVEQLNDSIEQLYKSYADELAKM
jgi:hypothetical protein